MQLRNLHPDIGNKLAVLFLALLLIGISAILVADNAFDRYADMARFVNQAGRLRMLALNIAYDAQRYATDPLSPRPDLPRLIQEFSAGLTTIEEYGALLGSGKEAQLSRLQASWQAYRTVLDRLQAPHNTPQDRRGLMETIDGAAVQMRAAAETTVQAILQRDAEARLQLRLRLYAVLLLGLTVTGIGYLHARRRILEPVARMAQMARRLAGGDLGARVDYQSNDELGKLVDILNQTAAATQRLVDQHREAKLAVQDSEQRNRSLWEISSEGIVMMDAENLIRYVNPAAESIFGHTAAELVGQPIALLQPADLRDAHRRGFERYRQSGERIIDWRCVETRALHKSGREFPVELSFNHIRLSSAEWFAAFFRDISHRNEALAALRVRERAMESAGEGIMITDAADKRHPILYVNPAFAKISGYSTAEVLGRNGRFFLGNDIDQPEVEALRLLLRERRDGTVVVRCIRKDGSACWIELTVSPVRDEHGLATHTISIFKDVTERKRQEEQLLKSAHHDALTGLANRSLLHDRLTQAIAVAHRHDRQVGLLFVDLDNFKLINDSLGHAAGDLLLQESARRLCACLREGDTVARIGGDEFVLLLTDMAHEEDIAQIAESILAALLKPFVHDGGELYVSASIGASVYPRDGGDGPTLLKHADIAMYRAKERGRNNFQMFTEEMQSRINQRLSLETHLRKALERGEFTLHYQPQLSLASGRMVGAEALIRWRHPELGMVSPLRFIPLAEETGLIVPIGEWVLDTACAQIKSWLAAGLPPITVAVNLSARQFHQNNLVAVVAQSLRIHELDPALLELELTESMVMQDPEQTIRILRQLKEIGVSISLDDFGTGYSSLSHLRRFPIDVLKVDQSFVRDVTHNADDAAIAASIIALAHSLQLTVVAEGVETQAQLHYLKRQNCDVMQGYYFSKPVPAAELAAIMAASGRLSAADLQADGPRQSAGARQSDVEAHSPL